MILSDFIFSVRGAAVAALGLWLADLQGCIGMMMP